MDAIAQFKENAKASWSTFAPIEALTVQAAPRLVEIRRDCPGARGARYCLWNGRGRAHCGTAGRQSDRGRPHARSSFNERGKARLMQLDVEWHEGDAEALPLGDAKFDAVVSQFGHMFAPRPEVAVERDAARAEARGDARVLDMAARAARRQSVQSHREIQSSPTAWRLPPPHCGASPRSSASAWAAP